MSVTIRSNEDSSMNIRLEYLKLGPEYIKVVFWPVFAIFLLFFFKDELTTIVKDREVSFGGVKIGQKVKDVNKNVQVELADIHQMTNELEAAVKHDPNASRISIEIGKKLKALSANLNKDISQLDEAKVGKGLKIDSRNEIDGSRTQAKLWEQKGFEYIIAKDIDKAIEAFAKAETNWPEYHNVSEIHKALVERRQELVGSQSGSNDDAWRQLGG